MTSPARPRADRSPAPRTPLVHATAIPSGRRSGDTFDVARRLTSERFVGRTSEIQELEQAAEAARKQPVLLLLGGDSGVGKSRLVSELEGLVSDRDVLVLRGEAVEQSEGELPYAPLTSALRPLVRARDTALEELSRGSRLQLGALFPGLDDGAGAGAMHDPSSQLRLFEALVELLDLLSERAPVTLILEDMHWADRSTRTFVSFLARSLRQAPMLVVLTYRSDELHRRHPLRALLSELDRLEHVRSLELRPFNRAELAEILADILCAEPDESLIDRLYSRSEGNPLYTEELLAAGLDGRGALPETLRDAFMLRIERLSPEAQRAARTIAVGRRLTEPVIAEVADIDRASLQEALREAVAEHVLRTDDEGRFQFRHTLLREVVYDDLLPGERGDLHLDLARTLEARIGCSQDQEAERTAAVAGHYAAAGDQPAALRAAVEAALVAREVHAYSEAAELAERALELWPRVPDAARTIPLSHIDLLTLAATGHGIAGDRERAETLLKRALHEIDPADEPEAYAGLLARLARVQWSLNRGEEGVETAQRALAMLPEECASPQRPPLMAWLARTRYLRGRFRDAIPDGEAALKAAIEAGDRHAEGEVLNTLGMARISLGDVEEGVTLLERAIEIAQEDDDLDNLGYAYSNLADMLHLAGRTSEALQVARQGLAAIPARVVRLHEWLMLTVAELAFHRGDWELMRSQLDPATTPLDRQTIFRLLAEAEVGLGEGRDDDAAKRLDDAEPLIAASTEPQWIGWFGALRGELHRRRYDLIAARAAVEHALGRLEVCTDDVTGIARASAMGAQIEADIARRAKDLRERAEERDALTRLDIQLSRLDAAAQEGGPVERAWLATGRAELARGRARNDPARWRKAAEQWEALERTYQAAVARWREAEAEVERDDRDAAAAAARSALIVAAELGARWLEGEVVALAQRARLQLDPDVVEASPVPDAEEEPFGLTPRERQVLALIAEGATNRQIGAALFMAEKTASVHVSRILSKLGVQSRTQAAAMAHRLHLT
jgi:ATP/maltotriose-dependent transcriptional regulator MalT